jgi:hypothetical protein
MPSHNYMLKTWCMNAFARVVKLQRLRLHHMVGLCCIRAYVQPSLKPNVLRSDRNEPEHCECEVAVAQKLSQTECTEK